MDAMSTLTCKKQEIRERERRFLDIARKKAARASRTGRTVGQPSGS